MPPEDIPLVEILLINSGTLHSDGIWIDAEQFGFIICVKSKDMEIAILIF